MNKKITKLLPYRRRTQQPNLILGYVCDPDVQRLTKDHHNQVQAGATLVALHNYKDFWQICAIWSSTSTTSATTGLTLSHPSKSAIECDSSNGLLKKHLPSAALSALLPFANFPLLLPPNANDKEIEHLGAMRLAQRGVNTPYWSIADETTNPEVYYLQQQDYRLFQSHLENTLPTLPMLAMLSSSDFVSRHTEINATLVAEVSARVDGELNEWSPAVMLAMWIALQGLEHC